MTRVVVLRKLNYPGDCAANLLGRVVGPDTFGQMLTIMAASYDFERDLTTAILRHGVHKIEGLETRVGWS